MISMSVRYTLFSTPFQNTGVISNETNGLRICLFVMSLIEPLGIVSMWQIHGKA